MWLAAAQPLGVVAQAVIGGILVLAKLNPALVSVHFLVSAAVVAAADDDELHIAVGSGTAVDVALTVAAASKNRATTYTLSSQVSAGAPMICS